jgi:shikimate dehydrogenase
MKRDKVKTKITGLFGFPVEHSLSPAMHNAAFRHYRMDWVYLPFIVKPSELAKSLRELREYNIAGVNLTIPHKEAGFGCMDELSEEAKAVQAVNTVKVNGKKLSGFNTDIEGFARSFVEQTGEKLEGKRILVLGTGGAGKSVVMACAKHRAKRITVANIPIEKARDVVKLVGAHFREQEFCIIPFEKREIAEALDWSDVLINATSVGLRKGDRLPVSKNSLRRGMIVYDVIYNPGETELLKIARSKGAKAVNGKSMLLHQGALSWEIWTGRKAPVNVMRSALG